MMLVIRRMREFAPKGTLIVFTGDHNCRETEEPAAAVSAILTNALYACATPPKGPWRTFNGWAWREREYSAVDAMKLAPHVRNARKGFPDADQIVGACKAGGIGGLVVVAKHHDGFCLWPTKTTQHNITKTPFWRGQGSGVRGKGRD